MSYLLNIIIEHFKIATQSKKAGKNLKVKQSNFFEHTKSKHKLYKTNDFLNYLLHLV